MECCFECGYDCDDLKIGEAIQTVDGDIFCSRKCHDRYYADANFHAILSALD